MIGLCFIVLAFSFAWWIDAKSEYRECIDRNVRAEGTARALGKLAEAMEKEKDLLQAQSLRDFQERAFLQGQPQCSRPIFSNEYRGN